MQPHIVETHVGEHHLVLCHYPMLRWPRSHYGSYLMFGHCHGDMEFPWGRSWDCGVDVHGYMPWTEEEIRVKMESLAYIVPSANHPH